MIKIKTKITHINHLKIIIAILKNKLRKSNKNHKKILFKNKKIIKFKIKQQNHMKILKHKIQIINQKQYHKNQNRKNQNNQLY